MSTQKEIIKYVDELYKMFPRYKNYTSLNSKITHKILDLYYDLVDYNEELKISISKDDCINLAFEILQSVDESLAKKFIEEVENDSINFGRYKGIPSSCTYMDNGKIYSSIYCNQNLEMVMALLHEFFHFINLECYNDIYNEDFSYFTEIYSMGIEIYAIYYLLEKNEISLEELKIYLNYFVSSIVQSAEESYVMNMILEIYNKYGNLDKKSIGKYVKKNKMSIDYINMLDILSNFDWREYVVNIKYVFGLPVAFKLAINMFNREKYKKEFISKFSQINNYNIEELFIYLDIDDIFDDNELCKVMSDMYIKFDEILERKDYKVKKIGEL